MGSGSSSGAGGATLDDFGRKELSNEDLQRLFSKYSESSEMGRKELERFLDDAFAKVNKPVPRSYVDHMFAALDASGRGRISYDDFKAFFSGGGLFHQARNSYI